MKVWVIFCTILVLIACANAQSNPVPLINQPLVPASAAPGGKGFNLSVNGTGFTSTSVVEWNGSSLITTVVSNRQLIAKVPAARIMKAGTATVTVVNSGAPPSNPVFFPINASEPLVTLARSDISGLNTAFWIATGDMNNDGKHDVVVAANLGIEVLLGNGDGTFGTPIFTADSAAFYVALGDFNGDGKLDVATAGSQTLGIYLGNGDGTLKFAASYATNGSVFISTGDFNADGKLDLVVDEFSDFGGSSINILLGNGDGTFGGNYNYPVGNAGTPAVGDFNGDGRLDVAAPNEDQGFGSSILIFLGNGDGTLQDPVEYAGGGFPSAVSAADLNGDGKLDLVVSNANASNVCVLLGNGDGTFGKPVEYSVASTSEALAVADFNNNGKLNAAVAGGGFVSLLLGNGNGTFQSFLSFPAVSKAYGLAFGDYNGDGRLDLATGNSTSNSISVFLQSTVTLSPPSLTFAAVEVGMSSQPQSLTLTNSGTTAITITSITFTGANPTDYSQTNTCGTSLPGGSSCTIAVTFTPTATGTRTATINVNDSAVGSPQTASLTGTGTAPAVMLSTTSLTFPTQLLRTTSPTQQVTLTNTGTGTLNITSIIATGDFSQTNTCGASVGVGASCTITVQFTPTQKGTRTGAVTITDNAPDSPQVISLSGCGTVVKLSAIGVNFGNQKVGTTSPPVTVTLTNTAGQTLSISSIAITGTNAGDFAQTNNCGASLVGGASCKIRLTFTPTVTGSRTAALAISDNGGCSPQTLTLSGNGI